MTIEVADMGMEKYNSLADVLDIWAAQATQHGNNASCMVVARTVPRAIFLTGEIRRELASSIFDYDRRTAVIHMRSGSVMRVRALTDQSAADSLAGFSYTTLIIVEPQGWLYKAPVLQMVGRLRSAYGVPCRAMTVGSW